MMNVIIWNAFNENYTATRPLGPHRLAQWLRHNGYTVKIIDFASLMTTDQLVSVTEKYLSSDTIAIGVSTTFWKAIYTNDGMLKSWKLTDNYYEPEWVIKARHILDSRRELNWIIGGPGNNLRNTQSIRTYFNWEYFYDYSEDTLLKYLDEMSDKKTTRKLFDIKNSSPIFVDNDFIRSYEFLPLETSRGCKFSCKFCRWRLIGRKGDDYLRSEDSLFSELKHNYDNWGTQNYFIIDDTFNESNEKINYLVKCRENLKIDLSFISYCRPDLLGTSNGMIDLLEQAGLKSAFFGVESFHPSAAKIIGKGWNGIHGKQFLSELNHRWKSKGMNFFLSFIIGIGEETEEDILKTHQWCKNNDIARWTFLPLMITRGDKLVFTSEFDRKWGEYGYRFTHPIHDWAWESDHWTWKKAYDLAIKLTDDAKNVSRVSSWEVGHCINSGLDITMPDLLNTKINDLDYNWMGTNTQKIVNDYVKKNLEWQI